MAKRGPHPESAEVLQMRGTGRADRPRSAPVEHLQGPPQKPRWLKGLASRLWDEKLKTFGERGQSVRGCEATLVQYCSLEAALIENYWKKSVEPPVSMINAHRIYAGEFFDTPGAQQQPSKGKAPSNPFNQHGVPPK